MNLDHNPVPEYHNPAGFSVHPGRNGFIHGKLQRDVYLVGQKSQLDCGLWPSRPGLDQAAAG